MVVSVKNAGRWSRIGDHVMLSHLPCLVLAARQRHENLQIVDPSFRGLLVQCGAFNTKTSLQLSLGRWIIQNHSLLNPLTNLLTEICEFTVSQLPMNIDIAQDINCDQSSVGCFLRTGSGVSQLLGNAEFISELKCQLMDSIIETRLRVHRKVLFYLVTRLRINLHPRYWALALSTALPASIPILKLTLVDFSNQAPCRPATNFRSSIDCTTLVVLPLTMLLTRLPMLHRWVMCGVRSGRKNSFRWRRRRQRSNLSKKWFQRSWLLALPFKKRVQAFGYQSWNHLYLQWKLSRGKSQCVCLISRV